MNRRRSIRRVGRALALPLTTVGAASSGHLLMLAGAALAGRARPAPPAHDDLHLAVVIPAHDEEAQIAGAVHSIRAGTYPAAHCRIVVVADNCTDSTATLARAAGAEVWERIDPLRRGKGYALEWAFARLLGDSSVHGVCVVDADCEVSENFLSAMAARLHAGADAVQAPYLISNPEASEAAALRWAGFALFNVVRPLGRDRLGLSSGLLGTGMAFSRRLLHRSPWRAFSYAEDREQHMRWVLDGVRVELAPEARVRSPAPNSVTGGKAQMARWDSGRDRLAISLTPRLLRRALSAGDVRALDAALEPMLPPQSVLIVINAGALVAGRLAGAQALARIAAVAALAQAGYVIGGLAAVDTPLAVWRALFGAPRFVGRRLAGLSATATGGGPSEWERTRRDPGLTSGVSTAPARSVESVRSPVVS